MLIHVNRLLTHILYALLAIAFLVVGLSPARSATESTVTMVGTVGNPASLTGGTTSTQSLTSTVYYLQLGSIPAGQSWADASFGIHLSQGRFATAPSVTITDAAGAAVGVTATATGSPGTSVAYRFSGDLPSGAILRFSGIALNGLVAATTGTAVQIIAAAGNGTVWRQYAIWQTLGTIASSGSTSVTPHSGWWWSAAESGRGYAIEVADGRLMLAAYMYRSDGTSVWYVANGPYTGSTFTGILAEYGGGETISGSWQPATATGDVATVTISFSSASAATIHWAGAAFSTSGGTTSIARYSFTGSAKVAAPATSSAPETGWYWNAQETGTGWFIEMQGAQIFLAVYLYDADGTARWYVAQGTVTTTAGVFGAGAGIILEADLSEYSGGQTLAGAAQPNLQAAPKGELSVRFTSTTAATVVLPNGRSLELTRFSGF